MSVVRVEKTKDYTVMSNYHLRDKNLSLKAKGLLSLMLSLPEDRDYTVAGLVSISLEEETAIKSAMNELMKYKYVERVKLFAHQTESKKIEYLYTIYEFSQGTENQGVENLGVGNLDLENQGQLNIDNIIKNNKVLNKEILNNKDKEKQKEVGVVEINAEIEDTTTCDDSKAELLEHDEKLFNEFWKMYPKKINRKGSFIAFRKIKNLKNEFDSIMSSLEKFKKSSDWLKANGQFIPYPTTFIHQERWKDEVDVTRDDLIKDLDLDGWF